MSGSAGPAQPMRLHSRNVTYLASVAVFQESVPVYRAPFFEGLRHALASSGVDLRLVHSSGGTPARMLRSDSCELSWATHVRARRVKLGAHHLVLQPTRRYIRNCDLVVLEHANKLIHNYPLLVRQRLGGPRVAFWGHGRNMQAANSRSMPERVKTGISRTPHWWFAYTQAGARTLAEGGFPADRITVVDNAIDTSALRRQANKLMGTVRQERSTVAYIGALYPEKRLDFLLNAADQLAASVADFHLYIIGDGELRNFVASASHARDYVSYLGPSFGDEKVLTLLRARLVLMPGLVGLGVLDACALQRPVVALDLPFHSPEFAYLSDGENSRILAGNASPGEYARQVANVLRHERLLDKLRAGCRRTAETYTIESMVLKFHAGIMAALSAERR